jgi:phenylalanyl-tRNA synthetase beta chain
MKISLEWLSDYVELPDDLDIKRIAHDLTMVTVEVEGAVDVAAALVNVVVGEVLSVESLPGAKALTLVSCHVGNADGRPLPIVCGARNVSPGMRVAVALPGATIRPRHSGRPSVVAPAEVGGVSSAAVLCGAAEIGLDELFPPDDDHSILDLGGVDATPGQPLADAIGWRDFVLEIDNKSLTNRPDLWGHHGIARELAAIYRLPLKPLPAPPAVAALPAEPLVELDETYCFRFAGVRISNVRAQPSPLWLRSRLARIGQRPRNLLVDLTNYVMFTVGQPSHAYDASRVQPPLAARLARDGERIRLLDGSERELDPRMLVIADQRGPVALGGVMGGADTAVGDGTDEIVLEMATFDALTVRRTAGDAGIRSEASSRFEKGIDTARVDQGLALYLALLGKAQPSARVTGFIDNLARPTRSPSIELELPFLQRRLGERLTAAQVSAQLGSLGFEVRRGEAERLEVTVPSWRATGDVSTKYDLIEEVARLHGYESFHFVAPAVSLRAHALDRRAQMVRRAREALAFVSGMQEIVTYPWVSDALLDAAGLAGSARLRLAVPPAPDQSYLRPSLIPGLLGAVVSNLRFTSQFRLFELGRVFPMKDHARRDDPRDELPAQPLRLAAALVGSDAQGLILEAKGAIEALRRMAQIASLDFVEAAAPAAAWADAGASLALVAGSGKPVGALAVLSSRGRRLADIKQGAVALFEMDLDELAPLPSRENSYRHIVQHPEITSDLSMLFDEQVTWASIVDALRGLDALVREITLVDLFRGQQIPPGKKSITLRLRLGSPTRTLKTEEVAELMKLAASTLIGTFGAERRA